MPSPRTPRTPPYSGRAPRMALAPDPVPIQHTTCRSCHSPLAPVLSLGTIFRSDFPRSAGTQAHPPGLLDLVRCTSPACGLVQLATTTPPDWLFGVYWYRSGVNETMIAELRHVVGTACALVDLTPHDTVVDIGANDGTLLQQYPTVGYPHLTTVAWEPAANFYEVLRPHVRVLYPEYFHVGEAWPPDSRAKIITAIAMFYDLDDPHAFLDGVTRLLDPHGVFVVQQAYLLDMLRTTDFTNICFEHLAYHDLHSMEALLAPHGLEVVDVQRRAINGGSFRTVIQFVGAGTVRESVGEMRTAEQVFFQDRIGQFEAFARRVGRVRTQLRGLLERYQQEGAPVDLYAASTKAQTLLQSCQIDARLIRQAWERSPEKIGRYVGVTGIPIVSEEDGRKDPPAALLAGAWSFREAFLTRERDYLAQGGRFIFPLPEVETVAGVQG